MDRGVFVDRSESEKTTVAEALDRYKREVAILKKECSEENEPDSVAIGLPGNGPEPLFSALCGHLRRPSPPHTVLGS